MRTSSLHRRGDELGDGGDFAPACEDLVAEFGDAVVGEFGESEKFVLCVAEYVVFAAAGYEAAEAFFFRIGRRGRRHCRSRRRGRLCRPMVRRDGEFVFVEEVADVLLDVGDVGMCGLVVCEAVCAEAFEDGRKFGSLDGVAVADGGAPLRVGGKTMNGFVEGERFDFAGTAPRGFGRGGLCGLRGGPQARRLLSLQSRAPEAIALCGRAVARSDRGRFLNIVEEAVEGHVDFAVEFVADCAKPSLNALTCEDVCRIKKIFVEKFPFDQAVDDHVE